jgi:type IV pilus assembly protein PilC
VFFPALGLLVYAFRRWTRSDRGRPSWDSFKLRIPLRIGDVVQKIALARFSRTLSSLVSSGVDIVKALEITAATSGNWVIERSVNRVGVRVQEGVPISEPLAADPAFPAMVSQMIRIGEETGELDKMLGKIADFYEDEVDTSIQSLTSIIEPVMMIGVGIMVGTIVISMYLPMFKMLSLVK